MITNYNPRIKGFKKCILRYWKEIKPDTRCKEILTSEPIINAYCKDKSIGDMTIRSRLPSEYIAKVDS